LKISIYPSQGRVSYVINVTNDVILEAPDEDFLVVAIQPGEQVRSALGSLSMSYYHHNHPSSASASSLLVILSIVNVLRQRLSRPSSSSSAGDHAALPMSYLRHLP
jgi:hypothetical protein